MNFYLIFRKSSWPVPLHRWEESYLGSINGRSDSVIRSVSLDCFHQIVVPHVRVYRSYLVCEGFYRCLITEKLKIKGWLSWRRRWRGHIEGSGSAAAVHISQWSWRECSPLKILHRLNLPHIQSLRRCIHRESWEDKQKSQNEVVSYRIKKRWDGELK